LPHICVAGAIQRASAGLIATLWKQITNPFVPPLSVAYFVNTSVALKLMGIPLPLPSDPDDPISAGPPSPAVLLENSLPVPLTKSSLTKALQGTDTPAFVRYRALQMLSLATRKLGEARQWLNAKSHSSISGD